MTAYIYDPVSVEATLAAYPAIRERLRGAEATSLPSAGFPYCRKSLLQIYRILANQHYPRLRRLLQQLNECIASGFEQPRLLRTRDEGQFYSALAEMALAHALMDRGFGVRGFDATKAQESVPDVIATDGEVAASFEVYAPRDWEGLDLLDDLRLTVQHVDVARDFHFEVRIDTDAPASFDPWAFSDVYGDVKTRRKTVERIQDEISAALGGARQELAFRWDSQVRSVRFDIDFKGITLSGANAPARVGSASFPTLTGYAPEGMFVRLLERRVRKKVAKRQFSSRYGCKANIAGLVVAIEQSEYSTEFDHPYYLRAFAEALAAEFATQHPPRADVVAFWRASSEPHVPLLWTSSDTAARLIATFFDQQFDPFRDGVLTAKQQPQHPSAGGHLENGG